MMMMMMITDDWWFMMIIDDDDDDDDDDDGDDDGDDDEGDDWGWWWWWFRMMMIYDDDDDNVVVYSDGDTEMLYSNANFELMVACFERQFIANMIILFQHVLWTHRFQIMSSSTCHRHASVWGLFLHRLPKMYFLLSFGNLWRWYSMGLA